MLRMTTFDSLRRVAVRGGSALFILACSLTHPQISSRLVGARTASAAGMSNTLEISSGWTTTANLNNARVHHTATLLANGKVLVVGGIYYAPNTVYQQSAELYDPATGVWRPTGSLNVARAYHTATLLPNGKVLVSGGRDNNFGYALRSAELYDPITEVWTETSDLGQARSSHTATLLQQGRVLVAGGENEDEPLNTAEIYDPNTGGWFYTQNNLNRAKQGHTATRLANGNVLVVGNGSDVGDETCEFYDAAAGRWRTTSAINYHHSAHTATLLPNGKVLAAKGSAAEVYDAATGVWIQTGNVSIVRVLATATLLPNGQVLFAAGWDLNSLVDLNSAEVYDPATGIFAPTGSLNAARRNHTATLLPNGQVLVTGGERGRSNSSSDPLTALNSAELYGSASASSTWANTGNLSAVRAQHSATLLLNGNVLLAGGFNCCPAATLSLTSLYNQATGLWSATGNLNAARFSHTATLLPAGKVLVAGGLRRVNVNTTYLNNSELYDPATGSWSLITDTLTTARAEHAAVLLGNGKVLIAGGINNGGTLNSAEVYDPATGQWEPTGNLTARHSHTATLLPNGKVLVAGGRNGTTDLDSAQLYDPGTGAWTPTGNLNAARSGHTASLLPTGKVLFAGGKNAGGFLRSAELYDPASGNWINTGLLVGHRSDHTATLLQNGKVLVAGGEDGSSFLLSAELYEPSTGVWAITASLIQRRASHTATLLQNGKALIAAGQSFDTTYLNSAELYDVGLGFTDPQWRPALTRVSSPAAPGGLLIASGSFFKGIGEASGGNGSRHSASNIPVLQLRRLDNEQTVMLLANTPPVISEGWSNTAFSATLPGGFNPGPAAVTIFTNAIPSLARTMIVQETALSPTSQGFAAAGGNDSFVLTTPVTVVGWTATSAVPWIHLTSPTTGTGPAIISYMVDAHTATTPRSGTITVADQTFTVLQGAEFADVPQSDPFYTFIGKMSAHGITSSCGAGNYCPASPVTRAQMAVFLERAMRGGSFVPPVAQCVNGHTANFTDVPCPGNPAIFTDFIEQLRADGVTLGCGVGLYCPNDSVTRAQMAIFIERALGNFTPPLALAQRFTDVPPEHFAFPFVADLAARAVTLGCNATHYCPDQAVTRGQMAAFLVRAFGL
jgi:N-acetylneuraminic acid mutarotase